MANTSSGTESIQTLPNPTSGMWEAIGVVGQEAAKADPVVTFSLICGTAVLAVLIGCITWWKICKIKTNREVDRYAIDRVSNGTLPDNAKAILIGQAIKGDKGGKR